MQVLRWSAAAALAAMVSLAPSFAGDDAALAQAPDDAPVSMATVRALLNAEREAWRASAGGAPEGLLSAKGDATLRIGGDVRIQYGIGTANGYGRTSYVAWDEEDGNNFFNLFNRRTTTNERSAIAGWQVARAQLDFDVDLSCDTKGFVRLRFDENGAYDGTHILDQAYWQWNNVGGSGFGLKVGLMDMPFGMWANTDMGGYDFDGVDRPLITDPFVRRVSTPISVLSREDANNLFAMFGFGDGNNRFPMQDPDQLNVTTLGLVGSYAWDDQVVVKAGIMAAGIDPKNTLFSDDGLTYANENRNIGFIDHVVAIGWNPCWLEGLHLEASYMGRFDAGRAQTVGDDNGFLPFQQGGPVANNPYGFDYTQNRCGDASYKPSFDLGVSYRVNDKLRAYAEGLCAWSPYYADGFNYALTLGADWRLTEKLMLGFGFDFCHTSFTGDFVNQGEMTNAVHANLYRLSVGGKYDFGNGLYLQAQYFHDIAYVVGIGDQDLKAADMVLLQTGFQF